ncbi:hypothetical protein LT85_p054 (plasmid) [Collimonas arenae]|uniref:Uncharacterized protein n=1 Tax=Collimonas arenae TaxID=279058 RepID=A0A0A1FHL0_9BURK|nr:hypothetical protein LT85_p054 [Collimonas arenae]
MYANKFRAIRGKALFYVDFAPPQGVRNVYWFFARVKEQKI